MSCGGNSVIPGTEQAQIAVSSPSPPPEPAQECVHDWEDGVCVICGAVCPHASHTPVIAPKCTVCGSSVYHRYDSSLCSCGISPPFADYEIPEEIFEDNGIYGNVNIEYYYAQDYSDYPYGYVIQKECAVYCPPGYDSERETPYNVLFCIHGGGGDCRDFTSELKDYRGKYIYLSELYDSMISRGYCEPLIIVSISTDNYYPEDDIWEECGDRQIIFELRNDLLPFIASKYNTYLGSGSPEEIALVRDHLGLCGISNGSDMTLRALGTGYADMISDWDIFSWYGVFSGSSTVSDVLYTFELHPEIKINYFLTGAGEKDSQRENIEEHYIQLLDGSGGIICDGNSDMITVQDSGHEWTSWITMMYNALLVFFR